jgi:hypothetical protein
MTEKPEKLYTLQLTKAEITVIAASMPLPTMPGIDHAGK